MSARGRRLAACACVALVAAALADGWRSGAHPAEARPAGAAIPFLAPMPYTSIDRDLPEAVKARVERQLLELARTARAAARLPATAANGCRRTRNGPLGPPAPRFDARILGHQAEVVFRFDRLPRSRAFRPWAVTVAVHGGPTGRGRIPNVQQYRVRGRTGRIALEFPLYSKPPYRITVESVTVVGRRGPRHERVPACPGTNSRTRGCLAGRSPTPHGSLVPRPILPLRGLDRATVERTLRYVIADEGTPPVFWSAPQSARCPSLRLCEVTYADAAFPDVPYRVRYRISGQQVPGCWLGHHVRSSDRKPYDDATSGRSLLAACAAWVR